MYSTTPSDLQIRCLSLEAAEACLKRYRRESISTSYQNHSNRKCSLSSRTYLTYAIFSLREAVSALTTPPERAGTLPLRAVSKHYRVSAPIQKSELQNTSYRWTAEMYLKISKHHCGPFADFSCHVIQEGDRSTNPHSSIPTSLLDKSPVTTFTTIRREARLLRNSRGENAAICIFCICSRKARGNGISPFCKSEYLRGRSCE